MMSEIGTLMVDCLATSYLSRLHPNKAHLEESGDEERAGDSSGSSPSQLILHRAKFKTKTIVIMALFFSLTTPVGIAIGIGIANVYNESSPNALIVEGIFNAASAGILIYMALVDLLAADFMHPKVQSNGALQFGVKVSLLLGAGCMSLLAKWA
ncbi:hypothetical protein Peur_006947 [Populus x canadensis]